MGKTNEEIEIRWQLFGKLELGGWRRRKWNWSF